MTDMMRSSYGGAHTANSRRLPVSTSPLALLGSNRGYCPYRRLRNHPNHFYVHSVSRAPLAAPETSLK
jgi:hypothetical protein